MAMTLLVATGLMARNETTIRATNHSLLYLFIVPNKTITMLILLASLTILVFLISALVIDATFAIKNILMMATRSTGTMRLFLDMSRFVDL